MKKSLLILYVLAFALCANAMDIVYKVSVAGDDANDGLTWNTAKRTVQGALEVAEYGDDIWVAEGSYYPTDGNYKYRWGGSADTDLRYFSFRLKNGVKIYGGFPAEGSPEFKDRDYEKHSTIFSGDIGMKGTATDNSYHVIIIDDKEIDDLTILDGITVSDGYNDYTSTVEHTSSGSAIFIKNSVPLIRNCVFTNNNKGQTISLINGAGGYISNCAFNLNKSDDYNISHKGTTKLFINETKFKSNSASYSVYTGAETDISTCDFTEQKGAIYISAKTSVSNSTFTKNKATPIYSTNSLATIQNCTFTSNTSSSYIYNSYTSSNSYAGAVYLGGGGTISNCTFTSNTSSSSIYGFSSISYAGAVYLGSGGTISNCTFTSNASSSPSSKYSYAGAVYGGGNITNCTFLKNSSGIAAICNSNVKNCTIVDNLSYGISSGTVKNSILWGNRSGSSSEVINSPTISNSIVRYGYSSGTNIITENPRLLPLANYGGNTLTMPVEEGSPAINAGVSDADVATDQRGFSRKATPTIGACEYQHDTVQFINIIPKGGETNFAPNYEFKLQACTDANIFEYIWSKNGAFIDNANGKYLNDKLSAGETAEYVVSVIYDGGIMESNAIKITANGPEKIYVKPDGNNEANGLTWNNAKATISSANDVSAYGTQIWIANGSYGALTMKNGRRYYGGLNIGDISLEERDFSVETVLGSISNSKSYFINDDTVLDGFSITGDVVNEYSTARIRNSKAKSISYRYLDFYNYDHENQIENCTATNNISYSYCTKNDLDVSALMQIQKAKVGTFLEIYNSDYIKATQIDANRFNISSSDYVKITDSAATNSSESGVKLTDSNNFRMLNSVIYNASNMGVEILGASENVELTNCTIYSNAKFGIKAENTLNCAIVNSILWGNKYGQIEEVSYTAKNWKVQYCNVEGGFTSGTKIQNKNPKLLVIKAFDLSPILYIALVEGSPNANAGISEENCSLGIEIPKNDARGVVRSETPSIGAFEYIEPSAIIHKMPEDKDVARGKNANVSLVASNAYLYVWGKTHDKSYWNWDVINGANDNSYSYIPTSEEKFTNNYYNGFVIDEAGGVKDAGTAQINVFDLLFVKQSATGLKNGSSWENAFNDLKTAINASMPKTRIYVAEGIYAVNDSDPANLDRKQAFSLKNDLEIYGGFPAAGEPEFVDRDISAHETILTADINANDADIDADGLLDDETLTDNAYRVFFHPSSVALNSSAVLDGFTIQGGYDDATEDEYKNGAGIHNNASSPTIRNCLFNENYSINSGGAICNSNNSKPIIENCEFVNNYAYYGGAICNTASSPNIWANEFSYNSAKYDGGAIRNNSNSIPIIEDCTFTANSANRGGAIDAYESSPVIKRNAFVQNNAKSSGGAIYAYSASSPQIENCTIYDNSAYFGGGIYTRENSNSNIVNCTITANTAKYTGGAIYSQNAMPVIVNSILWNNSASQSDNEIYTSSSAPTVSYNVISGGYEGGTNIVTSNPNLMAFDYYGGLTPSMPIDKSSSAWAKGILNISGVDIPTEDQSGSARSTSVMTIGSMEFHPAPSNLVASSGQYNDRVVLTWDAAEDGSFYKIYRNTVNSPIGAEEITPEWIIEQTYTDMGVEQGVNYYYFVRAAADTAGSSQTWYSTGSVGYAAQTTACNLTVTNGKGSGQYENGTIVVITANPAPEGMVFDKWVGDVTYVEDINDSETIIIMPAAHISVNATYRQIEYFTLTIENGTGSGYYAEGENVQIRANSAPAGQVFDKWVGDVETVQDITSAITTVRIPLEDITLIATYVDISVDDPFGKPVIYPNVAMTILGEVDYFGSPANEGCVIGAYVNGELRGKSTVTYYEGKAFVNITVNVNTAGEEIKFKIWNPADESINDASGDCVVPAVIGDVIGDIDNPFKIIFANDITLNLSFNEGWNQVSFNVGMDNTTIRTVLSSVFDNVSLIQGNGASFNPNWPDSLNTLKNFDNISGFWVKMASATNLSISGPALDVSKTTITLDEGWNNISYVPSSPANIRNVLATALAGGKIELIINGSGNFNPSNPDVLNSLKTMNPGEGYWVKAKAATSLTYDEVVVTKTRMQMRSKSVASDSDPFGKPVVYPNVQMIVLADVTMNYTPVSANTVVAAYVGDELRAKQTVVEDNGKSIVNLTIYINTNGETVTFKMWNPETKQVLEFPDVSIVGEIGGYPYEYPDNLLVLNATTYSQVTSPYDTWARESGLFGDLAKPGAKPFNDGITNIEKYAFGLDGTKATSYANNALFKQTTDGETIIFEYPVNKTATDITVNVLVSEDLKSWTETTATKSAEEGNFDIYKVSQPILENGKLFFKLSVSQ